MPETYDTAMDLLQASADTLEASAAACEQSADADQLLSLAGRIRRYLATSRSTTTLGMPRIASDLNELSAARIVHRGEGEGSSHVRIVGD